MELPFDQYQRYRLIGELCRSLRADGGPLRVLDVGGRTGVLRAFLPDDRVELVDVTPSAVEGLVLGTGERLPFLDDAFDVVVAADTLEHVPPALRRAFVRECCRVAGRWAILAGPYQHTRVVEAEELLQGFLRQKLGVEHQYLNEHRSLGLPERDAVEGWCREAGAQDVHAIGHGNLDRWLGLLTLELYLDDTPALRPLARRLFRFYSGMLYPSDREGVVYRHAVVASLDGSLPPTADELFGAAELQVEAQGPIAHVLTELAAFDRERDVFQEQRERLEGEIARRDADLEGHEESLAVARADLQGHRASLAELEQDLAGHQASLLETE
ncbi:MAG: methyltransferase domain-containing protein, partial [Planctomycetota bacterium]